MGYEITRSWNLKKIKGTVRPDWICMRVEKDTSRYKFSIFYLQFRIFEKALKFWAASYKNEPNLLLVPIMVCTESFLPIGWRTIISWKNPPKCCTILVWIAGCWNSSNILLTSHNPKNNCWLSHIFVARFGGKDRGWCPYNPCAQ